MAEDIKLEYEISYKSIREHREEQGISQNELARRTDLRIPQSKISNLEAGFINLTSNSALCLANAIKTNVLGLLLGQEMANKNIALKDREKLVMGISEGKADLLKAYKSVDRVEKVLDFGDRDGLGFKLSKELIAEKRAEKIAEKEKVLDFGNRDSFGRKSKIIATKTGGDFDKDFLKSLKGLDEDEKFLAKLKRLIERGKH
ncbi:hypothetical protein ES702_02831 [subsurface metagenome]